MAKEYAETPVAFVGVATAKSEGSARSIRSKYGVNFPNGVSRSGVAFALYGTPPLGSYGYVIDEEGKVVYGYSLSYYSTGPSGTRVATFALRAKSHLEDAKDPFGIENVPFQARPVYEALKLGQFAVAKAQAEKLKRSRDAGIKEFAGKVIEAVKEHEKSRLTLMRELAEAGRAGELQAEIEAFMAAFPRASRSKLRALTSKAKRASGGKDESTAAANFKRLIRMLESGGSSIKVQARLLCRSLASMYPDTYYGGLARVLDENWPPK